MKRPFRIPCPMLMYGLIAVSATPRLCATEPHPSLPPPGITDGLGANIHFTDARPGELKMLAEGGFRWVRMDLTWQRTERVRGQYDFSAYDRLVAALEPHAIRALFILDYSNPLYESTRSVATDEGRRAYARWAAAAAKHFEGRGILWEIWNEPNIRNFWQPEPNLAHYIALAAAATGAIREAAPEEAIIGPATSTIDLEFLEGCFEAGLLTGWDAVSVHPYRRTDPETVVPEYARLRQLIARYAPPEKSIPILSGEWGYSAAWQGVDPDRQGKLLSRQWLVNLAHRIPISIWYDWHDDGTDPREPEHHFGTVSHAYHQGRNPVYDAKPAYLAARTLTAILSGYRFEKRVATGRTDDYVLLFTRGDRHMLAVWTTANTPRQIRVSSSECTYAAVTHTGDDGGNVLATGEGLTVSASDSPLYLVADRANPTLMRAAAARTLAVSVAAGPGGRQLTIQVDNRDEEPFLGTVHLVGISGIEPVREEQSLDLAAGATGALLSFALRAPPASELGVGVMIADDQGRAVLRMPIRHVSFVPDDALPACAVIPDGDPGTASNLSFTAAAPPQPLPNSGEPVFKIDYDLGHGWSFLRVAPKTGNQPVTGNEPAGFGIWIYGDGHGASPRLRVRDATGQTWQPSAPLIHWEGWRFVEFPLDASSGHWGGANDGVIHYPLAWDSYFLLDKPGPQRTQGTIYITAPVILH